MADPGAAQTSGRQGFVVLFDSPEAQTGRVVAFGTVNAAGTRVGLTSQQNPDGTVSETSRMDFPQGSLSFSLRFSPSFAFDAERCVTSLHGSGTYEITGGTGAYVGAQGGGTFRFRGTFVARRAASACPEDAGVGVIVVRASGTLSLPTAQ